MKIKYKYLDKKYCLGCEELGIYDFGDSLEEAKKNFKKSCKLILDFKLDEIIEEK